MVLGPTINPKTYDSMTSSMETEWKRRAMERAKIAKELLIERDAERDLADKLAEAVTDLRTRLAAMGQGSHDGKGALDLWRAARTLHSENK